MKIDLFRIFIGSPSDTIQERKYTENVINELNTTLGRTYNIRLESLTWEKNTFPGVGEYPQAVINRQIEDNYDLFIGIMWKKFGSPTPVAQSATEEEFNRAYENYQKKGNCKNLMFYFNTAPLPQDSDLDQFKKVLDFKNKIGEIGLYYSEFNGEDDYKTKLKKDISACIMGIIENGMKALENGLPNSPVNISDNFLDFLSHPEVVFTHPKVDVITIEDIFIPPNLKRINKESNTYKFVNLENLITDEELLRKKTLILGADVSGKTAISKYLFKRYFELDLLPLYINGKAISNMVRTDALTTYFNSELKRQYNHIKRSILPEKINNEDFILIIDDFQKASKGNEKYWNLVIKNIEKVFDKIVLVGDTSIVINDLSGKSLFESFDQYVIMELGPTLRRSLIEKWNSIGSDLSLEAINDIYRKNDNIANIVNSILGKNYIPAYPFFILGILQSQETGTPGSNYSLHGFYYEFLINESLKNAIPDSKDISFYYNFLVSFCFSLFQQKTNNVEMEDFDNFFEYYCLNHDIRKSDFHITTVKDILKKTKLLTFNSIVNINQKYVYYFFVAKYISINISRSDIRNLIDNLVERVFRDEYANIIMFVTHLTKDEYVINAILKNSEEIFKNYTEAKLEDDINSINSLISEVPKKIIGVIDIKQERNKKLLEEDELENKQKEFDNDDINYSNFSLEDDINGIDIIARMNLAFKTIDILGQITKKYWGELTGPQKYNLVDQTYKLGLRTLSMCLNTISRNQDDIVEYLKEQIVNKYAKEESYKINNSLSPEKIRTTSNNFIIGICYLASWGTIKRISNSLSYDKLQITFNRVLEKNNYNSYKLISLSNDLTCKGIPMKILETYSTEFRNNKMCFKLLQDLVVDHMYMFDISYKKKLQISSFLDININKQRYINGSSQIKRE